MDTLIHHLPSMHDYRDRDIDSQKHYLHRPSSRPALVDNCSDSPTSSPFVMAPASISSVPPPSSHMNGSSESSLKGQAMWNEDPSHRMPPSGYLGGMTSHNAHRSPIQAHRYTPGAPSGGGLLLLVQSTVWFRLHHLSTALALHRVHILIHRIHIVRLLQGIFLIIHCKMRELTGIMLSPRSPKALGSGRTVTPTGQRITHPLHNWIHISKMV